MRTTNEYFTGGMFAGEGEVVPRVMIAPQRYIQGDGVIDHIGRYIGLLNARRVKAKR